jgi:hypothetical protein
LKEDLALVAQRAFAVVERARPHHATERFEKTFAREPVEIGAWVCGDGARRPITVKDGALHYQEL